jgi:hypothetical protein
MSQSKTMIEITPVTIMILLGQIPIPLLRFVVNIIVITAEKHASLTLAHHLLINLSQWSSYQSGHLLWYIKAQIVTSCADQTALQRLKAATINQVPDSLPLSKHRDCEPLLSATAAASGPVTKAMPPNTSYLVTNTMTGTTSAVDSQDYTHPGFSTHRFPLYSAPTFLMQTYPTPNYSMPVFMYAPLYGYPSALQGATQAIQPNGFPAPAFLMQNYPAPT